MSTQERRSTGPVLAAALSYVKRGWPVLALHNPTEGACSCGDDGCDQHGKHPRFHPGDLAEGCHSATTSATLIRTWWKRWPRANVGIATGKKAGFWVLDVDGDEGRETLWRLEKEHGALPATIRQLTGGGGEQLFFEHVPGLTNQVKFAPGLDLRTCGGLVVVPPSLHRSGRTYAWDVEHHPDDVKIAPAPAWLLELVRAGATAQKKEPLQPGERIGTGARNTTLFNETVRLLRLKVADDAVLGAIKEINAQRCDEPLPLAEIEKLIPKAKAYLAGARERAKRAFAVPPPTDDDAPPEWDSRTIHPFPANGAAVDDHEVNDTAPADPADAGEPTEDKAKKSKTFDQLKYARAFASQSKKNLLFVDGDQWWGYKDNYWRYIGATMARARMQHFLMRQKGIPSAQLTSQKVRSTLDLAGPLLGPILVNDLNPHAGWIPLRNGVYDTETGNFFPHDPQHRFTYCLPYDYDPHARCPEISRFFHQVLIGRDGKPCLEWVAFMEEWFGVCLTPGRTQTTLVNVGEGGNGKGVTARLLQRAVGSGQHTAIDVEMLHDPYHRAALVGKLVGFINEPSRRALEKNGGVLKAISGDDEINARNPCERVFNFFPTARLVVSCNDLPATRDLSRGYFRRLILIEWRYQPPEPDTSLDDRLGAEMPGLFNLAMEGLKRFRERGNRFAELPESDRLKADYQHSQDTTAQFKEDVCICEEGQTAPPAELYRAYAAWCKAKGCRAVDANAFGQRLTKLGVMPSKVITLENRSTQRVRPGIALDLAELQAVLGPSEWRRFTGKTDQKDLFGGGE